MKAICCNTNNTLACDCACCVTDIPYDWWTPNFIADGWTTTEIKCDSESDGTCTTTLYWFVWAGDTYYKCEDTSNGEDPPRASFTLDKTIENDKCLKIPHAGCTYSASATNQGSTTNVTVTIFGIECDNIPATAPSLDIRKEDCSSSEDLTGCYPCDQCLAVLVKYGTLHALLGLSKEETERGCKYTFGINQQAPFVDANHEPATPAITLGFEGVLYKGHLIYSLTITKPTEVLGCTKTINAVNEISLPSENFYKMSNECAEFAAGSIVDGDTILVYSQTTYKVNGELVQVWIRSGTPIREHPWTGTLKEYTLTLTDIPDGGPCSFSSLPEINPIVEWNGAGYTSKGGAGSWRGRLLYARIGFGDNFKYFIEFSCGIGGEIWWRGYNNGCGVAGVYNVDPQIESPLFQKITVI